MDFALQNFLASFAPHGLLALTFPQNFDSFSALLG